MHASLAESPLNDFPATELLATKGLARSPNLVGLMAPVQ
nr:hypothetical protein Q903MT_gene1430 [Picea sitchensis]